jgi:uncharacterized protein GlcG (DUF336 family)
MNVSLEEAQVVLARVQVHARQLGVAMCATVLDSGANPVATIRMDGAQLGAYQLSVDKAWTAVAFQAPTDEWSDVTLPGEPAWGFSTALAGRVIVFGGGVPLTRDGQVIGGVGVSGSTSANDGVCARAGAAALADLDDAPVSSAAAATSTAGGGDA